MDDTMTEDSVNKDVEMPDLETSTQAVQFKKVTKTLYMYRVMLLHNR